VTAACFLRFKRFLHQLKLIFSCAAMIAKELFLMAHKISDECVACGACADTCPVGAIAMGDGKYEINADECVDCGACEDGCPVEAIAAE
jgi:ferredoxin